MFLNKHETGYFMYPKKTSDKKPQAIVFFFCVGFSHTLLGGHQVVMLTLRILRLSPHRTRAQYLIDFYYLSRLDSVVFPVYTGCYNIYFFRHWPQSGYFQIFLPALSHFRWSRPSLSIFFCQDDLSRVVNGDRPRLYLLVSLEASAWYGALSLS